MVSVESILQHLQAIAQVEYRNIQPINIYDSFECKALATQAIAHRYLKIDSAKLSESMTERDAIPIILVEDNYPGWLESQDLAILEMAEEPYKPEEINREAIASRLDNVIAYAEKAMMIPNEYLWGGTIGPNLDCSGLVQRAYGSQGVWLPRDAYQQEAFTAALKLEMDDLGMLNSVLKVGDLIFFGPPKKATHVAIYLGNGQYIHSSGKDQGRNGIGIDSLTHLDHPVSQNYAQQYRGAGRVMTSYCP